MPVKERLDKIREGGELAAELAKARMREAVEAIDEGEFVDAARYLHEASVKLDMLAYAQGGLAVLSDMYIARAEQLSEGDRVKDLGVVVSTDAESCESCGEGHRHFRFANGEEAVIPGRQELLVHKPDVTVPDAPPAP